MLDRVQILQNLTMPFFPMRPRHGRALKTDADYLEIVGDKYYVRQPKLNGDRAALAVILPDLYIQNRHGSWYKYSITNGDSYLKEQDHTLFDGEVYEKKFYPFETLVYGGKSMLASPVEERIESAESRCSALGVEWKFAAPDVDWFRKSEYRKGTVPVWEGVVLKRAGSQYVMMGTDSGESMSWLKRKWRGC